MASVFLTFVVLIVAHSSVATDAADRGYPSGIAVRLSKLGPVYADSRGMTLYSLNAHDAQFRFGKGIDYCSGRCTRVWSPLRAPILARPIGHWRVVWSATGPQWSFMGSPVFTYVREEGPGSVAGDGHEDLWTALRYVPPVPATGAPSSVSFVFAKGRYLLADSQGRALYTSAGCDTACVHATPFVAGLASRPSGDWNIIVDGDRPQWTYRSQRVFVSQEQEPTRVPVHGTILRWTDNALPKVVATALPGAPHSYAAPTHGEHGFILTAFAPAIFAGRHDCPDGLAYSLRENYLASMPPRERVRLLEPANQKQLATGLLTYAIGPHRTNVCENPESFDHPLLKTLQGKIAHGLNLDGRDDGPAAADDGCPHANFTSPSGEQGIDNQAYRALGCSRHYRSADGSSGELVKLLNAFLAKGQYNMVLLLRGVDSLKQDDEVEVILATTDDPPILDSRQNVIPGASFTVSSNASWRNVLRGRIRDGILTSEPTDVRLSRRLAYGGIRGERSEWDLRQARVRLMLLPDGSLQGILGAYQPIRNIMEQTLLGGIGAATVAGVDCAAQYATVKELADGLRDPRTGQCTAASVALEVVAVAAFVFDQSAAVNSTLMTGQ